MANRGNPNWQQKYGEPTKPVRLPVTIADTIKQMLNQGNSGEQVLAWIKEHYCRTTRGVHLPEPLAGAAQAIALQEVQPKRLTYVTDVQSRADLFVSQLRTLCFENNLILDDSEGLVWLIEVNLRQCDEAAINQLAETCQIDLSAAEKV